MKNPHRSAAMALVLGSALVVGCRSSDLVKGRCDKAADCSGGLTCDDRHTCVPQSPGSSPCSNDAECGTDYLCDNLHWCVCQVPNQNLSPSADPCTNGTMPTYRGVTTDGGMDGGDGGGGGDGGDGGRQCQGPGDCAAPKPVCGPAGACVECGVDSDCKTATKPICDATTNACMRCTTDAQCVAKLGADPGVCMFHQDGHCATSDGVVYVKPTATGCLSTATPGGGTASMPFCQLTHALASADTRRVFVLRGGGMAGGVTLQGAVALSFVGQGGAVIAAENGQFGLRVTGADVHLRNVRVSTASTATIGIVVDGGGIIRLDGVEVANMPQGGLRVTDGGGYDIVNSILTGNGGTQVSAGLFIGGALLDTPAAGKPSRFAFNTVVGNKRDGVICAAATQTIDASLLAGNLGGGTIPDYAGCALATNSKALGSSDPMLTSTFRLTGSSTCVDFVTAAPTNAPDHDIDGVARPQGGGFDCGASEWKP